MAAEMAQEIVNLSSNLEDRVVELEDEVSVLKARLNNLESGKKPHDDWVYSAPDISEEELEEMGYDEDAVEEMSDVLQVMKNTTRDLRWGACDKVYIGDNSYSQILKYNERFLPHWRELCDGLAFLKNSDVLKDFSIFNVELPNHVVSMIIKALRGKNLSIDCVWFEKNNFETEPHEKYGVELASWLLNISTVKRFHYEGDKINYEMHFKPLITAINKHESLRHVDLNDCNDMNSTIKDPGEFAYDLLCSILEENCALVSIQFKSMKLQLPLDKDGKKDSMRLINALIGCPKLVSLDITNSFDAHRSSDNVFDHDEDAWMFSEVFDLNPKLEVYVGDFNASFKIARRSGS